MNAHACMSSLLNMTVNAVPSSVPSSQEKALAPMDMKAVAASPQPPTPNSNDVTNSSNPQQSMKRARFLINDILSSAASAAALSAQAQVQHHNHLLSGSLGGTGGALHPLSQHHHHQLQLQQLQQHHLAGHFAHHNFPGHHHHHHHHLISQHHLGNHEDMEDGEKDDVDVDQDVLSGSEAEAGGMMEDGGERRRRRRGSYSPQSHHFTKGDVVIAPGGGLPGTGGDLPKDLSFHRRSTCGDSGSDYDDSESIKGKKN